MASLLANRLYNLAEGIQRINCRYGHGKKKSKTGGIKYKGCECCLEYASVKDDLIL